MIGLGSNRLTVCRRGGMSVTQAGRGGMEWLAGGRGVTPYSVQATAALKAQFLTQWPTIRDYGFAHPEIVPYVNANPTIGLFAATYDGFGDMIINNANDLSQMTFETPKYPASGVEDKYRMWLYRTGNPTGWNTLPNIFSHTDWQNTKAAHGRNLGGGAEIGFPIASNGPAFTVVRFFYPTTMPTGYKYWRYDAGQVYVNEYSIATGSTDTNNYDFTGKIKLNEPNFVAIRCNGSTNWGNAFGFYY